jgi:hypothetical protein
LGHIGRSNRPCQNQRSKEENGKSHEKETRMELGEENVLILAKEDGRKASGISKET